MSNLRLTIRDRKLLTLLANPCLQIGLNCDELISYLWALKQHSENQNHQSVTYSFTQSIKRRLKQITEKKLIRTTRHADETKQCYFITQQGLAIVNENAEEPFSLKKRVQNIGYSKHSRLTASSILHIIASALYSKKVTASECREMKIHTADGRFFIPDAVLGMETQEESVIYYVEADNSTETADFFNEKIRRYYCLFEDSACEAPEYLLVVASTLNRARFLFKHSCKTLNQISLNTPFAACFYFSHLAALQQQDPSFGWVDASTRDLPSENSFVKGLWDGIY